MSSIRGYEKSLCRCGIARGEHGFDDFDADGRCKRADAPSPRPVLEPAQLATTLERLRLMRHQRVMEARKPAEGDSLVPFLNASLDCTAIDNAIKLLERELAAVRS